MNGVFQRLLGDRFDSLPHALRAVHALDGERFFAGKADIGAPDNVLVRPMISAVGLPAPGRNVDVHVRCALLPDGRELWRRDFDGRRYESILEAGADGRLIEHFGPLEFRFDLFLESGRLHWSLARWRIFGMPAPRLGIVIHSSERLDPDGRYRFRVEMTAPLLGRIVDYGGVLAEAPGDAPVWVYDGVCIFCDGWVRHAVEQERTPAMRFVTIQSAEGRRLARENGVDPDNPDSFLFLENGRALKKFDALFALLRQLRGPARLLMLARLLPRFARNFLYDRVARNRYSLFGKKSACELPSAALRYRFALPDAGVQHEG